ncbi:MAG: hypothetical protein ACT6FC_05620 [Methanosarcinaceae archaeon]
MESVTHIFEADTFNVYNKFKLELELKLKLNVYKFDAYVRSVLKFAN